MPDAVDDEAALEEVLALLDTPPEPGSADDSRFGARLRQVVAASSLARDGDHDDAPRLALVADLRSRLEALARRRADDHPFGDHPDGIGPTLGMDFRPPSARRDP